MDVLRLTDDFKPDVLIEGWSSMIWTERYSGLGEFSMTTPLISDTRAMIPEGTYITLLDSDEIMQVDTHSIEREENGGVLNKISGSTFPAIIAERDTVGSGINSEMSPSNWNSILHYTPAQMAAALLWNHLVDNSFRFTGPQEDLNGDLITYPGDWRLLIPNLEIVLTDILPWVDPNPILDVDDPAPAGTRRWVLDRGPLDKHVFDILSTGKLGLRTRRPKNFVTRSVGFMPDGGIFESPTGGEGVSDPDNIRLEIYQGRDLSDTVVFRYDAGQIEKPTYLYSIRGYKNVIHVTSAHTTYSPNPIAGLVIAAPGVDPNISGLNRRVLYFDAGNMSDLDLEGNYTDSDWIRVLTQKALVELQKYNKVALFDGEISPISGVQYGEDYKLGDIVTLQAEYDLEAKMMISEYIRSQDENGETGYPTLSFIDEEG